VRTTFRGRDFGTGGHRGVTELPKGHGRFSSPHIRLAADGFPVTDDLVSRLSAIQFDHINFLGGHAFTRPPAPGSEVRRNSVA